MNVKYQEKQNINKVICAEDCFTQEEKLLFELIRRSLSTEYERDFDFNLNENDWGKIIRMAEKHGIIAVLSEEILDNHEIQIYLQQQIRAKSKQTVLQQYRLLFLCKFLVSLLESYNISVVILKGVTIGAYYPVPELRKSGDVDLLLMNSKELNCAKQILMGAGFYVKEEQLALHHICFYTSENIEIELHTMLAEPFDNNKTNVGLQKLLDETREQVIKKDIMGVELPVLPVSCYAFELLLHMLQHFLRSGFGLRLLCDWVVFWQNDAEKKDRETYLELISRFGVKGFSEIITQTCVTYLGLKEECVQWMKISETYPVDEFMREILDAEEFGKTSNNRMVVLRGTGVFDYIREFHHQMRLNYPELSKCFIFWPVLWGITLIRFISNTQKLRKTSVSAVLKETARRSRMMKKIALFKSI